MDYILQHLQQFWEFLTAGDSALKLAISAFIGLVIGLEREIKQKPAGLKTTLILTTASCLLTLISIHSADTLSAAYQKPMDPLRLPAQIVSGIGFLGGGVILRRNNDAISGLTTAAMLWASGGLGIAIGTGFYKEAGIALFFIMIGVEVIPFILRKIGPRKLTERNFRIRLVLEKTTDLEALMKEVKDVSSQIGKRTKVKDKEDYIILECWIQTTSEQKTTDIYSSVNGLAGVKSVEVERIN